MKVDFFLIGAPRSGTNAMFSYLKKHPNICFSEPKQPEFFSSDLKSTAPYCANADEYHKKFFPHYDVSTHSVVAEGSVFYLYSEKAIENILSYNENAKFLVMLRNPVDMAYSWYSLTYYGGQENVSSFEDAWSLQKVRQEGKSIPKVCVEPKLLQYKKLCSTGAQVASLLQKVDREKICFVIFDDFKDDPRGEYFRVLNFLGLPLFESEDGFAQENANREWRSPWVRRCYQILVGAVKLRRFLGVRRGLGISSYLTKLLPMKQQKRTPLPPAFRKKLQEEFHDDVLVLSQLLNKDLSFWVED